ncbi:hypothetical protein VZ111_22545, partial [Enterobacter hormaechei]
DLGKVVRYQLSYSRMSSRNYLTTSLPLDFIIFRLTVPPFDALLSTVMTLCFNVIFCISGSFDEN